MAHGFRGATTNRIGAIAGQRRGRRIGSIAGAYRGRRMGAIAGNEALEGDGLDEQSQRHADYAEMAYRPPDQRLETLHGRSLDKGLSDDRTAIYADPSGKKKTIMALRGTQGNLKDLSGAASILGGMQRNHPIFKKDIADLAKVRQKYGGRGVHAVGHSMGATRGSQLTYLTNGEVATTGFNKGQSVLDRQAAQRSARCKLPRPPGYCGKVLSHLVTNDALSQQGNWMNAGTDKIVKHRAKKNSYLDILTGKPHNMQNFARSKRDPIFLKKG